MEKTTIITWEDFKLEITYDPEPYPEVLVTDIIYGDDIVPFFEKVQNSPNFLGDVAQLAAEDYFDNWADELEERERFYPEDFADEIYETRYDK